MFHDRWSTKIPKSNIRHWSNIPAIPACVALCQLVAQHKILKPKQVFLTTSYSPPRIYFALTFNREIAIHSDLALQQKNNLKKIPSSLLSINQSSLDGLVSARGDDVIAGGHEADAAYVVVVALQRLDALVRLKGI